MPRVTPILLLLVLCLAPAGAEAGEWPFGGGKGSRSRGLDLWNLGPLGAKAWDADKPLPAAPASGRRSRASAPAGGADAGPLRLRIEALYPDGPAAKAGLLVGDVIVGVGRSVFKEGSLGPLAEALTKAESQKGALTLLVLKAGGSDRTKVLVQLPVGGKPMAKPTKGAGRAQLVEGALAWLAARQAAGGGFAQTLSGINGAVVQTSLAGLAWIAGGSTLTKGLYKEHLVQAVAFVRANVGKRMSMGGAGGETRGGASWNQTNWGVAHAAIFLGELHAHEADPEVKRALLDLGASLVERQEATGGWAHGPGGPNALGYVELNILSGLALCGMGLASQAGYKLNEAVIDRAEAYLQQSSNGDGGVGYSHKPGQRGRGNIGRSAGCWLGFMTLGKGKSAWGQKMKKWTARNAGNVLGGHASLMQHLLLAGVAAHALGGKAQKTYWAQCERDLTLARAPDGSFQPRPWRETLSGGSNSDVSFGEVWTTAAWAIVLACEPEKKGRPGLPYWMGLARE